MNNLFRVNYSSATFFIVLLFFPMISCSASAFSQDELFRTLEKFVRQGQQQIYRGTFVHLSDDGLQTIRVIREKDAQGRIRESFIPLDNHSSASDRLLTNHYCLLGNSWKYQFQAFSSSFPFRINNTFDYLSQNYQIVPDRLERVAGLNAQHISFLPRDKYRYGYELWFEPETGILLKYQLVNDRKETIEQYLYSTIFIEPSAEQSNTMKLNPVASEKIRLCSALRAENINTINQFIDRQRLPHGFKIISYRQQRLENSSRLIEQLHLSDGLAAVSLFVESFNDSAQTMDGIARIGPLTVAGKTMNHYQITVVGAIPVDTAIEILDAIKK